jgi:hypothetical protein
MVMVMDCSPDRPFFESCVKITHGACACSYCEDRALEKALYLLGFYVGIAAANSFLKSRRISVMARKLYIFTPTGRMKIEGPNATSFKWLGGYTASYAFLGDHHAKMLGVGARVVTRRMPAWHNGAVAGGKAARGGASRHDPSFRGWG